MATLIFIFLTLATLTDIYVPILYKDFFDFISSSDPKVDFEVFDKIKLVIYKIGIAYFFMWTFWRITSFMISNFEVKIMNAIYNDCFDYLHKHSYKFFANTFGGSLVRKVSKFVRAFETISDKYCWDLYPLFLRIIVSCAIVFLTNQTLGYAFMVWIMFFLSVNYLAILYKLPYDIARSESDTKLSSILADTITNNTNIKLFARHDFEYESFKIATKDNMIKTKKEWDLSLIIEAMQAALVLSLEIAILWIAFKLWSRSLLGIGEFIMIQTYFFQLADRLWQFGRHIREVYSALADSEDMVEILYTPHEIQDSKKAKNIKIKKGNIEFQDVTFAYNKKQKIFENFNLQIKGGERIAFVGDSGGGKSSLIKLLFRFFDINSGEIIIDKQNIKDVSQDSLRSEISLVPQDPILFHRTLIENIRYGRPDASDEEVIRASKLAHSHDFVEKLPHKYDTYVGERGIKLSGGERQRVAIARAILKNAPIIVLDEATSSLDSMSEKLIQEALDVLFKNKTVIVIAHRLSTIMEMDRIVVIRNGKIVEEGSHNVLLAKKGYYYKLWNTQVGGFIRE